MISKKDTYEQERVHDLLNYLTAAYLTVNSLENITEGREEILRAKESMRECIAVAKSCFTLKKVGIFSINEEILKILSIFEHVHRRHGVSITYKNRSPKSISCGDRIEFRRAISNIVKNAVEAASHSTDKSVKVNVRKVRDKVVICVIDSGKGVCQEIASKIGNEKVSSKSPERGFGMLSTKRIIEKQYKGNITLENNTKKNGARCTISLYTK